MESMDRRTFMGAMGAMGVAAALGATPMVALADTDTSSSSTSGSAASSASGSTASSTSDSVISSASGSTASSASDGSLPLVEDMDRLCDRGGTTLTLEELNKIRKERVDAAGDFTKEDGTVVPAVWHKLDTLTNTYGLGGPDPEKGEALDYLIELFDNDEEAAEHYLEMPWGKVFSAYEYAQESDRDVDECKEICEDLAQRGLLFRAVRGDDTVYYHLAFYHGFYEQGLPREYDPEYVSKLYTNLLAAPTNPGLASVGTPIYYSIPCDASVVSDTRVMPLNDYREVINRHDTIALLPCACSLRENIRLGADVPAIGSEELKTFKNTFGAGHSLERCIALGEEAEYYLMIGAGRQITKEEALEILDRNVNDEGLVVQLGYTNNSEVICSCHSDCCGVLGSYRMTDPDVWNASPIMNNVSNYLLQYDKDACLKCGACAERCPMQAIEMGDDGYPVTSTYCVRCGQCALICPAGARTLTARSADDRLPVPDDHMDDHNRKFGYRVQHDIK